MIFRGGTSKGIYLLEKDLPPAGPRRDSLLLRLMGSPDPRQIDGLGGAASVTSKAAILAPSRTAGADVDYTFAQVALDMAKVSYSGNCGNISSGVGPFAIESGLVLPRGDVTEVRIFNTNTGKILLERVQTPGGLVCYRGETAIPGVPGTAAPVPVSILDPAASVCPALLPTGHPRDVLKLPGGREIEVSIVDAANPLVFVRASDVGLAGMESPKELDEAAGLLDRLEQIRGAAAVLLGFASAWEDARSVSPGVPKLTLVAAPADYTASGGAKVGASETDLLGRMLSMQKAHPTYALTGAMCTAASAVIPGTLVQEACRAGADPRRLRIGQPAGVMVAGCRYRRQGRETVIEEVTGLRTARLLMRGTAYV